MTKIIELKKSANVEYIVHELFELIMQKDSSISNDLNNFDDNIGLKVMRVSEELSATSFNKDNLLDKKSNLEAHYKDISKFVQVFSGLDKKISHQIQTNNLLSSDEKENLQQRFLFDVRQKHFELFIIQEHCTTLLSTIKVKQENVNKPHENLSFLEQIKAIRHNLIDNRKQNKLK